MSVKTYLMERAGNKCELCSASEGLEVMALPPKAEEVDSSVLVCATCRDAIENPSEADANHWRCLNESMWSEHIPVQVLVWRVLDSLSDEAWAQDLKTQMYMEDDVMDWAMATASGGVTKDSNGTPLSQGDSVTLIKDLVVKGANFTAKRGTLVKSISLTDDPKFIEGRVNGTQIVLVAAYLKKV